MRQLRQAFRPGEDVYKRQGFKYQYGSDDTIEIFMNEKWIIFEQRDDTEI